MSKFENALRRSTATFLFATLGFNAGAPLLNLDVAAWKSACLAGIAAVLNLVYRWAERNKA